MTSVRAGAAAPRCAAPPTSATSPAPPSSPWRSCRDRSPARTSSWTPTARSALRISTAHTGGGGPITHRRRRASPAAYDRSVCTATTWWPTWTRRRNRDRATFRWTRSSQSRRNPDIDAISPSVCQQGTCSRPITRLHNCIAFSTTRLAVTTTKELYPNNRWVSWIDAAVPASSGKRLWNGTVSVCPVDRYDSSSERRTAGLLQHGRQNRSIAGRPMLRRHHACHREVSCRGRRLIIVAFCETASFTKTKQLS